MTAQFFDRENTLNPKNGSVLTNDVELNNLLEVLRVGEPVICELIWQKEFNLLFGIGGNAFCAQHSRTDGKPPYLMAVSENHEVREAFIEFMMGGTLTPIWVRYRLSFETLRDIAKFFLKTGGRTPSVSWEEVGPYPF